MLGRYLWKRMATLSAPSVWTILLGCGASLACSVAALLGAAHEAAWAASCALYAVRWVVLCSAVGLLMDLFLHRDGG